ncbi:hypothetical protein D3C74_385940 [compost metagenome]
MSRQCGNHHRHRKSERHLREEPDAQQYNQYRCQRQLGHSVQEDQEGFTDSGKSARPPEGEAEQRTQQSAAYEPKNGRTGGISNILKQRPFCNLDPRGIQDTERAAPVISIQPADPGKQLPAEHYKNRYRQSSETNNPLIAAGQRLFVLNERLRLPFFRFQHTVSGRLQLVNDVPFLLHTLHPVLLLKV